MTNKLSSSINVITVPSHISLDCPYCGEEIKIMYNHFYDMFGEPCDWKYSSLDCPKCQSSIDIDNVKWN